MSSSPLLFPNLQETPHDYWVPTKHLQPPEPPPQPVDQTIAAETAAALAGIDGKALLKKTKPRRTVDYFGPVGRWLWLRKMAPTPGFIPYLRPAPPYIIDLLPPAAYSNPSTSLCTKFIHTSTNKVRGPVNVVSWTPEGRRVLTGSTSGEFTLWNGLTFNFETILQAHDAPIRTFEYSHSGTYLASGDQSGMVKYFLGNMNNVWSFQAHAPGQAVRGLSFSPNDGRFVTCSDDGLLKIWGFEESREERILTGHGWDVRCVQWHPSKGLLVSGSKDNLIKFWDPRTGTCISTLHQHKNTIQALAWSPNGDFLAAGSRDQSLSIFDIRAMKEFRLYRGHKKEVCSIAWHPVHPILVSGGSEGDLLYWDLYTPNPTHGFVPSGKDHNSTSNIITQTHEPRAAIPQAHESNVWSLSFHPLGHLLVSGSNDHTTRFWARERPGDTGAEDEDRTGADDDHEEDWDEQQLPGLGGGGYGGDGRDVEMFDTNYPPGVSSGQGADDMGMPGLEYPRNDSGQSSGFGGNRKSRWGP